MGAPVQIGGDLLKALFTDLFNPGEIPLAGEESGSQPARTLEILAHATYLKPGRHPKLFSQRDLAKLTLGQESTALIIVIIQNAQDISVGIGERPFDG